MNREEAQKKAAELRKFRLGSVYKHFKGNYYILMDIGVHSETSELMVIYKAVKNPGMTWIRPLEMFDSDVDKEKYPDVEQKLRFEPVLGAAVCPYISLNNHGENCDICGGNGWAMVDEISRHLIRVNGIDFMMEGDD